MCYQIISKLFSDKIIFCLFLTSLVTIASFEQIKLFPIFVEAQKTGEKCIKYDKKENMISVECKYATFLDMADQIKNPSVLGQDNQKQVWILNAGIYVEKDAILDINSSNISWLKIVPDKDIPSAILVDGSLRIDKVKITSWNKQTNDYIKLFKKVDDDEDDDEDDEEIPSELRPFIRINEDATGPTIITNSELAYLGYSGKSFEGGGYGGLTFYGGEGSILKNNEIHDIWKGFYSKGMVNMLIEGNRVYNNVKYGLDPHSETHDMIIRNNTVYDNGNAGIICSGDCYNITIEGNTVFNNGHGDNKRGIALSVNSYDSHIRNNIVYNEDKCISIGRESHDNEIYDNTLYNCLNGVYIKESFNNQIYNNKIENVDYGLVATEGSEKNIFHSNTIIGANISETLEDSKAKDNKFETLN